MIVTCAVIAGAAFAKARAINKPQRHNDTKNVAVRVVASLWLREVITKMPVLIIMASPISRQVTNEANFNYSCLWFSWIDCHVHQWLGSGHSADERDGKGSKRRGITGRRSDGDANRHRDQAKHDHE